MNKMKAYFVQRLGAFIIDMLIVSLIASLIYGCFPISKQQMKNIDKLNNEVAVLADSFIEGELEVKEYLNKSIEINYDISYQSILSNIIYLVIIILYFIVFQFYNKGQTLGKKLLKIKIIKADDSELGMNDLVIRALIINSVLVMMVDLVLVLFVTKGVYMYSNLIIGFIETIVIIVSAFMVMYSKNGQGIHDKIAKTKVVLAKEGVIECEN